MPTHYPNSQSWISNNYGSRNDDLPRGDSGLYMHDMNSQSRISNNYGSRNDDLPRGDSDLYMHDMNSQSRISNNFGTRQERPREGARQSSDTSTYIAHTNRRQWQNDQYRAFLPDYSNSPEVPILYNTVFDSMASQSQYLHGNSESWISYIYGSRNDTPEGETPYSNPPFWSARDSSTRGADPTEGARSPIANSNRDYSTPHHTPHSTTTQSSLHNIWLIAQRWHNSSFSSNDRTVTGSRPDEWGAGRTAGIAQRTRSVLLHPASGISYRNINRGLRSEGSTTCRHAGRALAQTVRRRAVRAMRASVCQKTTARRRFTNRRNKYKFYALTLNDSTSHGPKVKGDKSHAKNINKIGLTFISSPKINYKNENIRWWHTLTEASLREWERMSTPYTAESKWDFASTWDKFKRRRLSPYISPTPDKVSHKSPRSTYTTTALPSEYATSIPTTYYSRVSKVEPLLDSYHPDNFSAAEYEYLDFLPAYTKGNPAYITQDKYAPGASHFETQQLDSTYVPKTRKELNRDPTPNPKRLPPYY